MSSSKPSRSSQGAGELSGLLKKAEELQRELEQAQSELKEAQVEGADATGVVDLVLKGDGVPVRVRVQAGFLGDQERRVLEDAVHGALRVALERLFELRREKLGSVTRGLDPPGLFD